jgi:segregation and condensation protein B
MDNEYFSEGELNLIAKIEALLFVASGPITPMQLATIIEAPQAEVEFGLDKLRERYMSSSTEHGIRLQKHKDRYQLTTAPSASTIIEKYLGLAESSHLSQAALETLAIVAYRQPVTRPQVDAIRGVNSDAVLKNLLSKGLIQEIGRADAPGRPILYSTTPDFLQHFGINSLEELPPLDAAVVENHE